MARSCRRKINQKQKKAIIESLSKRDEIKDITTLFLNMLSVPELKGIDVMIDGLTPSQFKRVCNLNFRAGKLSITPEAHFRYAAYANFKMPNGKKARSCFETETPWTEQMVSLFHEGPDALYKRLSNKDSNKYLRVNGERRKGIHYLRPLKENFTYFDFTGESPDPLKIIIDHLLKFYSISTDSSTNRLGEIRRSKMIFTLTKLQFESIGKPTIRAMNGSFYSYKKKDFSGYRVSFSQFFETRMEIPKEIINFIFEISEEDAMQFVLKNGHGRKRSRWGIRTYRIDSIYLGEILLKYNIRPELRAIELNEWPLLFNDWCKNKTVFFEMR